jgi:hypothetical protein
MTILTLACGKVGTIAVDTAKLGAPDFEAYSPIIQHLVRGRLTTVLLDCHAGITVKELGEEKAKALSTAAVNKKIESLYNGEIREFGGGGRTADPVESEIWDLVEPSERGKMKAQYGVQKNWPKGKLDANVQATIDRNRDGLTKLAKKRIAEREKAMASFE